MTEARVLLRKYGPRLWTRDKARAIRVVFEEQLEQLPELGTLVINAKGVEVFDFSFANELFGRLVLSLQSSTTPRFVVVEQLEPYARENLEKALQILNLTIVERRPSRAALLGKAGPPDEETFAALSKAKRPLTAVQLAEQLGTTLTAMNERLAKLARLGLVARVRAQTPIGREPYAYVAPA